MSDEISMAANINPSGSSAIPNPISASVPVSNASNIPPAALLTTDARFPPTRGAVPAYYPRYYPAVPGDVPGVPVPTAGLQNVPIPGSQPLVPGTATDANINAPGTASTGVPQLTYMEGQLTTQAMLVEQQRRIKQLESELYATRAEVQRLTAIANEARGNSNSNGSNLNNANNSSLEKKPSSRYWTPDEHKRFLEGLELFGPRDIKAISRHVGTRSATQVRTHAQKYYLRIERERERAKASGTDPPPGNNINPREARSYTPAKSPVSNRLNTQVNSTGTSIAKTKAVSPRKRSSRHRSRNTHANKPPPQPDEGKTNGGNLYLQKKAASININNVNPTSAGKKLPFEQRKRSHPSSNLLPTESNDEMTIPISIGKSMPATVPISNTEDDTGGSPTSRRVKPRTGSELGDNNATGENPLAIASEAPIQPKIEAAAAEPISGTGAGGLLSNGDNAADSAPAIATSGSGALPPAQPPTSLVGVGSIPFVPSSSALHPPFATSSSSLALHHVPSSGTLDRALASYVSVPASFPQVPSVGALGTLMPSISRDRELAPLPRVSSTTGLPQIASSGALQLPRVASSLTAAWNGALAADKAALAADRTKSSAALPTQVPGTITGGTGNTGLRRAESGTLRRVDSGASIGLGRGLARTNSILSLLSGLPTAGASENVAAMGTVTTPGNSISGGNNTVSAGQNGNSTRAPFEHMELDEDPSKWPAES